jgi:Cof subfamily protein (haloacid dehalogenase superfamily)
MLKFIATDMDGTLLDREKKISDKNIETLLLAQQQGIILALASGRGEASLRKYAMQLGMYEYGGYLICNNGQKVVSLRDDIIIENPSLSQDLTLRLFRFAKLHRIEMFLEGEGGTSLYTPNYRVVVRFLFNRIKRFLEMTKRFNKDSRLNLFGILKERHITLIHDEKDLGSRYFKIGIADRKARIDKTLQLLTAQFDAEIALYRVNDNWMDVVSKGVSKALGMRQILEKHAISPMHAMAIGDSENDIDMLIYAGIGVAMRNAMPSVLLAADETTDTNECDGVALVVLKHL